jgi:hypothetical protein
MIRQQACFCSSINKSFTVFLARATKKQKSRLALPNHRVSAAFI